MRKLAGALILAVALLFAACGEDGSSEQSQEEMQAEVQAEALASVCAAAEDVEQRVGDLLSLSIVTASVDQIEDDLAAIGDDVQTIADNAGDLSESERSEVVEAAESLQSTVETSVSEIGGSQSIVEVAGQITDAFSQLGSSVEALLTSVDC